MEGEWASWVDLSWQQTRPRDPEKLAEVLTATTQVYFPANALLREAYTEHLTSQEDVLEANMGRQRVDH